MLLRLFLFFLVLLLLPDWYIYRTYIYNKVKSSKRRCIYWIPSVLLIIGMIFIFYIHEPRPASMNRLSGFLLVFLCITVPKVLFALMTLICRFAARLCRGHFNGDYLSGSIAILSLAYILYGATEGKQHFCIREVEVCSGELPEEFDGYRIIQLSDIHSGSWAGNSQAIGKAVDIVNTQQPDLIVFTGDIVNNVATELDELMPELSRLSAKDGIYSVLGNHDYSPYIRWTSVAEQKANLDSLQAKEAHMGWTLLNNRNVHLYHRGDSIALAGVENSGNPPFPNYGDLSQALQGTQGMFKILLSHDPSHWRREVLPASDVQLMLAGHTHEMQFRMFGFSPAMFPYPEHSGLYQEGNQMLYVNIGLGYLMFPMRLGAWPEITLITLRKSK